ncbi:MAG: histidine phosphatase family protein, partial [Deltaproteobacteria bacterium]|nr:histidine phosphatase family protein [Deltaproteobacteria bacterium]
MRFIFIRHGHCDGKGRPQREKDKLPLNDSGRRAARAAGAYLKEEGIVPDAVFTTKTERTQETARVVLDALGGVDLKLQAKGGGFRSGSTGGLDSKLDQWLAGVGVEPQTLLFVGHHISQSYCLRHLEGTPQIPAENRACVLVYEGGRGKSWTCVGAHVGLASTPSAEEQYPHVYVSTDGWVVAYYPKERPSGWILPWADYSGGE